MFIRILTSDGQSFASRTSSILFPSHSSSSHSVNISDESIGDSGFINSLRSRFRSLVQSITARFTTQDNSNQTHDNVSSVR